MGCVEVADCSPVTPCHTVDCVLGLCVQVPTPDGTACDDGAICTSSDRCEAGRCVGTVRSSSPELLGTVPMFGGFRDEDPNPVQGLVATLDSEHVVFADRLQGGVGETVLSLVRVGTNGLELVDRLLSPLRIELEFGMGLEWTERLSGFLVPLGEKRFAFVASKAGIEIYDFESGRLKRLSSFPLASYEAYLRGVVATSGKLWTCNPTIQAYEVAPDGTVTASATLSSSCAGLTLSEDASVLFVSSSKGITAFDVTSSPPTIRAETTDVTRLESLTTGGGFVAGIRAVAATKPGEVMIFRAADLTPIAQIEASLEKRPVSTALDGTDLFVQTARAGTAGSYVTLDRYSVSPTGLEPRASEVLRNSVMGPRYKNLVPLSTRDGLLAVQPWRDVFRVSAAGLERMTGAQQGALEQLVAVSADTLDAIGPDSAHRFDLSDPLHPTAVGGGRILGHSLNRLRLLTGRVPPRFINVAELNNPLSQETTSLSLTRITSEGSAMPAVTGSLLLEGGPAQLSTSAGRLFQISSPSSTEYRIRRFGARSGILGKGSAALESELDQSISVAVPTDLPNRAGWGFAADADGNALGLLESRNNGSVATSQGWLHLVSLTPTAVSPPLSTKTVQSNLIAISEGSILVAGSGVIELIRLDQSALIHVARRDDLLGREIWKILRWDGERAYLATTERNQSERETGVWVISGTDLSDIAYYETDDDVLSMADVGEHLAFAMKSGLSVATPACR